MSTCPVCSHPVTRVLETRRHGDTAIRRRRICGRCAFRWSTLETMQITEAMSAAARLGHRPDPLDG